MRIDIFVGGTDKSLSLASLWACFFFVENNKELLFRVWHTWHAKNNERSFVPVPQEGMLAELKAVLTGTLADIDHDGDLDVILSSEEGMKIFLNQENFTFEDVTANSNLPAEKFRPTTLLPVDFDRNVAIDILAGSATSPGWGFLENIFHNLFLFPFYSIHFLFSLAKNHLIVLIIPTVKGVSG